jgi:hypothetical protein
MPKTRVVVARVVSYSQNGYLYSTPAGIHAMPSARRRKNVFIDQRRIDRVKALLRTETETETIDRALALAEDFAAFQADVDRGLAGLIGRGGFSDRFSGVPERA